MLSLPGCRGRKMALTLRTTGLPPCVYPQQKDYTVFQDSRPIGRLYEDPAAVCTALYEAANVLLSRITRFSKLKRWGMDVGKRRYMPSGRHPTNHAYLGSPFLLTA